MDKPISELNAAWVLTGFCHIEQAHERWQTYYNIHSLDTHNNEIITDKRDLITGKRWEWYVVQLGPTKLKYDLLYRTVEITRRVTKDTRIETRKDTGLGRPMIATLKDSGPNGNTVAFTLDIDNSFLKLENNTKVDIRYYWSKAPTLAWSGPLEDKALIEKHYTSQNNVLLGHLPMVRRRFDLWIYLDFVSDVALSWEGYMQPRSRAHEACMPELQHTDINSVVITLMGAAFPSILTGKIPEDICAFPGIFLPPESYRYSAKSAMLPDRLLTCFNPISKRLTQASAAPAPFQPVPLATILSSTAGPQKLNAVPASANPTWAITNVPAGTIKVINGAQHYLPPGPIAPTAVANPNCKTLVPAMLRDSTRQITLPAVADVLEASSSAGKARATWVCEYFDQTHYFKATKEAGKLRFSLYYTSLTGSDIRIALDNITWHILAGNGTVDSQGFFSPANRAPTPYTVLLAVDQDRTEQKESWYWAMTIIPHPFTDVDAVIELLNGQG